MHIKKTTVGNDYFTNCYLVWNNKKNGIVIDPGFDGDLIFDQINELQLKITTIILTHGHFDHLTAVDHLRDRIGVEVLIHADDQDALVNPERNLSIYMGREMKFSPADRVVEDGEVLAISAGLDFKVIHTPGHSPGCICLYNKNEQILFSGDTIFASGVGRTDFPHCSQDDLFLSLEKMIALPLETKVYCGHGPDTTIEEFVQYYQSIKGFQ